MKSAPHTSRAKPKRTPAPHEPASLLKARGLSEHAKEVVEDCVEELATVNTTLQKELNAAGAPPAIVEQALHQNAEVEAKVEECAEELESANANLVEGIQERRALHVELSKTHDALIASRRQARDAKFDALHDPLTGLPNFTLFKDRLELALAQARRHEWRLAVMFIDLDQFKNVNDVYGHHVGDACLKEVAQRLESVTRGEDTVCRRSGDEFQFLMLEAKEEPVVRAMARKLAEAVCAVCDLGEVKLSVKSSIGISVFPDDGHSAQELLEKADAAMYAAKHRRTGPMFWNELEKNSAS